MTTRIRIWICSGRLVDIIASVISAPHSLNREATVGDAFSRLRKEGRSGLSLTIDKRIGLGNFENGSDWLILMQEIEEGIEMLLLRCDVGDDACNLAKR